MMIYNNNNNIPSMGFEEGGMYGDLIPTFVG